MCPCTHPYTAPAPREHPTAAGSSSHTLINKLCRRSQTWSLELAVLTSSKHLEELPAPQASFRTGSARREEPRSLHCWHRGAEHGGLAIGASLEPRHGEEQAAGILTALDGVGGRLQGHDPATGLGDVHAEDEAHARVLAADVGLALAQLDVRVAQLQDPRAVDAATHTAPSSTPALSSWDRAHSGDEAALLWPLGSEQL